MLNYATGLAIAPLEEEFGWTRVQISLGPSFAAITYLLLAPFTGLAIDRYGPRWIGIVGVCAICVLGALLGTTGPSIYSWWAVWLGFSIAALFATPGVWTAPVARAFSAARGLAIGLTMCGSGFSSIVTPYLTNLLMEAYGWRWAFVGLAAFWAAIAVPILLLYFSSPIVPREGQPRPREAAVQWDLAAISALRSRRFIQLSAAALLFAAIVPPLVINVVPILVSIGFSRGQAADMASVLGAAALAGRVGVGFLLDRVDGRYLAAGLVCMPAAAALLFLEPHVGITAMLLLGLALGAEYDIVAYLTSRYFRLGNYGLLFGVLVGLIAFAGAIAPLAVSAVFDSTRSYLPFLWTVIIVTPFTALLFLLLGRYPPSAESESRSEIS
jgi:MFS family permease